MGILDFLREKSIRDVYPKSGFVISILWTTTNIFQRRNERIVKDNYTENRG